MSEQYIGNKITTLTVRCSYDDKTEILTRANAIGVSQSAYLRMAALDELPQLADDNVSPFIDNPELLKLLSFTAAVVTSTGLTIKDAKQSAIIKSETKKIMKLLEDL